MKKYEVKIGKEIIGQIWKTKVGNWKGFSVAQNRNTGLFASKAEGVDHIQRMHVEHMRFVKYNLSK